MPTNADPSCYVCLGTGRAVGFGAKPNVVKCHCTVCHRCGDPSTCSDEGYYLCREDCNYESEEEREGLAELARRERAQADYEYGCDYLEKERREEPDV